MWSSKALYASVKRVSLLLIFFGGPWNIFDSVINLLTVAKAADSGHTGPLDTSGFPVLPKDEVCWSPATGSADKDGDTPAL